MPLTFGRAMSSDVTQASGQIPFAHMSLITVLISLTTIYPPALSNYAWILSSPGPLLFFSFDIA